MAAVIFDIQGNPAGAQAAFDKMLKKVAQLKGQLAGLNTTTKRGAAPLRAQNSMLAQGVRHVAGMAAGYLSVFQGVRLVGAEIRSVIEAQKRMKEASLSLADVQISAIRNLGATTAKERDKFTGDIFKMSQATGISEKDLTARAGAVFSARQNLSYEQAMDAVLASAALIPEDAETGKTMAVAAINMAKKTGRGAEANLGLLKAIARTAQVVEWKDIARNVGPAVLAGMQAGMTAEESGSFWASMTHGREDPTGKRSSTAAQKQFEQLVAMFPKEDVYSWKGDAATGEYKRVLKTKGTGLESAEDIIQYIRSEYAKGSLMPYERYMAEAVFTKGTRAVMREILRPGTQIAEGYEFTKGEMPTPKTAGAEFRRDVGVMTGGELQQTAIFSRTMDTFQEHLETIDQVGARLAIAREKFGPLLKDVGGSAAMTWLKQAGAYTSPDEFRAYIKELGVTKVGLERPMGQRKGERKWPWEIDWLKEETWIRRDEKGRRIKEGLEHREPTQLEGQQAQILGRLIDVMTKVVELQEKELEEQKKTTRGASPLGAAIEAAAAMEPR